MMDEPKNNWCVLEMEKHKTELSKLQEKGPAGKPKLPLVNLLSCALASFSRIVLSHRSLASFSHIVISHRSLASLSSIVI
jgi:hypothetical protein